MKVLAIGDVHCNYKNIPKVRMLADFIIEMAQKHKPDYVAILGDLHDTFEKAHLQAFNAMTVDFLEKIGKYAGCPVNYVVGNHDLLHNQIFLTDEHFFKSLKDKIQGVEIVDSFKLFPEEVAYMPYVAPGKFWEAVGDYRPKYIFCHQEFKGAKMGAIESKTGDETYLTDYAPIIISGHIHDHQTLNNVLYVGAPMYLGFGDSGMKSISLLNLEGGYITEERIETPIPKKHTIKLHVTDVDKVSEQTKDEVRLIIAGGSDEIGAFKKTNKYKVLEKSYKIVFKPEAAATLKQNTKNQGYADIMKDAVAKEPRIVQDLFEEVMKNAFGS